MQISTRPVPESCQQRARKEPPLPVCWSFWEEKGGMKGNFKLSPEHIHFGVIFPSYLEDSKYESG